PGHPAILTKKAGKPYELNCRWHVTYITLRVTAVGEAHRNPPTRLQRIPSLHHRACKPRRTFATHGGKAKHSAAPPSLKGTRPSFRRVSLHLLQNCIQAVRSCRNGMPRNCQSSSEGEIRVPGDGTDSRRSISIQQSRGCNADFTRSAIVGWRHSR